MLKTIILPLVVLAGASAPAWAEGAGNAFRGQAYAQAMCKSCHAVAAGETTSPNPAAPAFQKITPAYPSAAAFATWVNTKHPPIPNSLLKDEQADDIAAYIVSLKTGSAG